MKTLILFLVVFLNFSAFGQVWGRSGATWHYEFGMFFNALATLEYEGDTTINGFNCQKIAVKEQEVYPQQNGTTVLGQENNYSEFTRFSGDSVFWYADNQFFLLYDFGASPGDSWIIHEAPVSQFACDTVSIVEVVNAGTVNINGETLRYIDLLPVQGGLGLEGRAIEGMGLVESSSLFGEKLFPMQRNCDSTIVVDFFFQTFNCYQDDNLGLYNVSGQPCDNIVAAATASLEEEPSSNEKSVLKVYDLLGRAAEMHSNQWLIIQYTDGSTEKVFMFE